MNIEIKVDYIQTDKFGHLIISQPTQFYKDTRHIESIFEIEFKRFSETPKYSLSISDKSISPMLDEIEKDPQLIPKADLSAVIFDHIEKDMVLVDQYVEYVELGKMDEARNLDLENKGRISKLQSIRSKISSEVLELTLQDGKKVKISPSPALKQIEGKTLESKWESCLINTPEFVKSPSAIFKTTNERKNLTANLTINDDALWDTVIALGKEGTLVDIELRYKEPRPNATNITGELISIKESSYIELDLFSP